MTKQPTAAAAAAAALVRVLQQLSGAQAVGNSRREHLPAEVVGAHRLATVSRQQVGAAQHAAASIASAAAPAHMRGRRRHACMIATSMHACSSAQQQLSQRARSQQRRAAR